MVFFYKYANRETTQLKCIKDERGGLRWEENTGEASESIQHNTCKTKNIITMETNL